jgi:hypothetical protein
MILRLFPVMRAILVIETSNSFYFSTVLIRSFVIKLFRPVYLFFSFAASIRCSYMSNLRAVSNSAIAAKAVEIN